MYVFLYILIWNNVLWTYVFHNILYSLLLILIYYKLSKTKIYYYLLLCLMQFKKIYFIIFMKVQYIQFIWHLFFARSLFKINLLLLTNSIINHQLIKTSNSTSAARSFVSLQRAILPAWFETQAFVSFSLPEVALKRWKASGTEKKERIEIGAITTLNDSHCVHPSSPISSCTPRHSFFREGKKRMCDKSPSPFASLKLPRFTTESQEL